MTTEQISIFLNELDRWDPKKVQAPTEHLQARQAFEIAYQISRIADELHAIRETIQVHK